MVIILLVAVVALACGACLGWWLRGVFANPYEDDDVTCGGWLSPERRA